LSAIISAISSLGEPASGVRTGKMPQAVEAITQPRLEAGSQHFVEEKGKP